MFSWFSKRQNSTLLLLDEELHSSALLSVLSHMNLVIPDDRQVQQLTLCIVVTQQLLCSAGSSGQAGVWAKGTNICIQKNF